MDGPFDYTIDVQSPFTSLTQGLKLGADIADIRAQQQTREQALQQAQLKAQQDAEFNTLVRSVIASPSEEGYRTLMTLRPDLSEGYKRAAESLGVEGKKKSIAFGWQALSALESGSLDTFKLLMDDAAAGARNSGNPSMAKGYEDALRIAESDKNGASFIIASGLAGIDDKFNENYAKLKGLPSVIEKGEAEAIIAGVEADFAESDKILEQELQGWNIKKVRQDVLFRPQELELRRSEAKTAAINAGLKGEQLRLELARIDRDFERDAKEYKAEAESNFGLAQETEELLLSITDPKRRGDLELALGATGSVFPSWTAAGAMKSDIERLSGLITKDNLRAISGPGVMTDGDRAFALAVVSGLRAGGNQKQQIARIEKLRDKFAGADKNSRLSSRVARKYGMPVTEEIPVPQTQADFDKLPRGAVYIDPDDGKQYRKP